MKSLLKVSINSLRNDYRNLKPKNRYKSGWIETHYHQKELLRKSHADVVVIGNSIVAGLTREAIQLYGELAFHDIKLFTWELENTELKMFHGVLKV